MTRNVRALLRLLAALVLAVCAASPALASVPLAACVAPLPAGDEGKAARALSFDCHRAQYSYGAGDYAVQLRVPDKAAAGNQPLVLRFASSWQDSLKLRYFYADGAEVDVAVSPADAARHMSIGSFLQFSVPNRQARLTDILVEVRGSANLRGILVNPGLFTHAETDSLLHRMTALLASLRHRVQLAYSIMVCALAVNGTVHSGAILLMLPGADANLRFRLSYLVFGLTVVSALTFIREFFGRRTIGPRLDKLARLVTFMVVLAATAAAVLAPWQYVLLDRIYYASLAATCVVLVLICGQAWRTGDRYIGPFILTWTLPIALFAARIANAFHLIKYSFVLENGHLVSTSLVALVCSLLVILRLRELSAERDLARAGEQSALRLANSDPLTGLLNRRAFINLAIGRGGTHRLMLIDIDRFKSVNDRYGHVAGDEVLRIVAKLIQNRRPADSLAVRLGGEEFGLLLPLSRQQECLPEHLLAALREYEMPMGNTITASIGFADGAIQTEDDWKRLYRLADAALYRAKADGRDRACRSTDFHSHAA